jgi:hypothetical protein
MSTSDGQLASAAILNAAYCSKSVANTVTGVQTLNAAGSGASITNLQLEVNAKRFKTYSTQLVTAGGTITFDNDVGMQYRRIVGDPGAVTVSTTPFGVLSSARDGSIIIVVGTDDSKPVTFTHNDIQYGCIMNGDIELRKYEFAKFLIDTVLERCILLETNVL